jgi:hypothetical protein
MIGILTMVDDHQDIRAWLEGAKWGHGRPNDPQVRPAAALAVLRRRHAADRRRSPGRAVQHVPLWFMRLTCERCGEDRMLNEAHTAQRYMLVRDIIAKMRHDGCGGRPARVELLTGIEGASSRPARKITLIED